MCIIILNNYTNLTTIMPKKYGICFSDEIYWTINTNWIDFIVFSKTKTLKNVHILIMYCWHCIIDAIFWTMPRDFNALQNLKIMSPFLPFVCGQIVRWKSNSSRSRARSCKTSRHPGIRAVVQDIQVQLTLFNKYMHEIYPVQEMHLWI